ncbi:MAG: hypothetical protein DRJ32_06095 [Thermoprotei archaeon]|nr:MAG: hypothetical protein DRJ32_06095 [Thermoprotei archaeon]
MKNEKRVEVIKAEVPVWLAEKFRRYVAERYGLRKGAISRAIADLIKRELGITETGESNTIDAIAGLGLLSDYLWKGEDLVEALRRRSLNVSHRRQHNS